MLRAVERVRDSVQAMQTLLVDPDRNVPRPMEHFPLAAPERRPKRPICPFYTVCEEEFDQVGWISENPPGGGG